MAPSPPSPDQNLPLEADWIKLPLSLVVDGALVIGTAQANWGGVRVDLTSPVRYLSRGFDHRGWAFGLGCSRRPELRYACRGRFTARGVEAAERLLADLFRDYLAVRRREGEVDAACRRTRQELADLHRDSEQRKEPLRQERSALRRAFKAGGLTQPDYQRRLKALGREEDRMDGERRDAERLIQGRFMAWAEGQCGRRVELDEPERLLSAPALLVRTPSGGPR